MLDQYEPYLLELWFGDDEEKIKEFGNYLIQQENYFSESSMDFLSDDKGYYDRKLDKLLEHKCKDMVDVMITLQKIEKVKKNIRNGKSYNKSYKEKDLGIATYLNSNRYKKRILSKSKYRKELKHIAKREEKERKEMRRLGYIKSKDPDEEYNKLVNANNAMTHALSDAYVQKHFL